MKPAVTSLADVVLVARGGRSRRAGARGCPGRKRGPRDHRSTRRGFRGADAARLGRHARRRAGTLALARLELLGAVAARAGVALTLKMGSATNAGRARGGRS